MKRWLIAVVLLGPAIVWPAIASAQPVAVLQVKAQTLSPVPGRVVLTLDSGTVIDIPASDINGPITETIVRTMETGPPDRQPSGQPGAQETTPKLPSDGEAAANITAKCEKDWPADFRLRAYCQ